MAALQTFRGGVSVDQLTVGGVKVDPDALDELQRGKSQAGGKGKVDPQPVPEKGTVAALTEALVAAGVLYEDDGEE